MNVMQTLSEFKQNLHASAKPLAGGVGPARALPGQGASNRLQPADSSGATTAPSGSNSTTITANDFLQLLVAEMKNQDPTADQDPNAYIDQLVQVNSLQQLISINQDLTPGTASPSGSVSANLLSQDPGTPPQHSLAARNTAILSGGNLGTAAGTPSASLALALAPPPNQPRAASSLPIGESTNADSYAAQNLLAPPALRVRR